MTNPNLPPAVYVPTGEHSGDGTDTTVELRRTPDGRIALLAYTALDRLVSCCGPDQPWVLVSNENLGRIHRAQPYDVILLDSELPAELRHHGRMSAAKPV